MNAFRLSLVEDPANFVESNTTTKNSQPTVSETHQQMMFCGTNQAQQDKSILWCSSNGSKQTSCHYDFFRTDNSTTKIDNTHEVCIPQGKITFESLTFYFGALTGPLGRIQDRKEQYLKNIFVQNIPVVQFIRMSLVQSPRC